MESVTPKQQVFKAQKIRIGTRKEEHPSILTSKSAQELKWEGEALDYLLHSGQIGTPNIPFRSWEFNGVSVPQSVGRNIPNQSEAKEWPQACLIDPTPSKKQFRSSFLKGRNNKIPEPRSVSQEKSPVSQGFPKMDTLEKRVLRLEKENECLRTRNREIQEKMVILLEENGNLAEELGKLNRKGKPGDPKSMEEPNELKKEAQELFVEIEMERESLEAQIKQTREEFKVERESKEKVSKELREVLGQKEKVEKESEELRKSIEKMKEVISGFQREKEQDGEAIWKKRYVELERRQEENREEFLRKEKLEQTITEMKSEIQTLSNEKRALLDGAKTRRVEKLEWEKTKENFERELKELAQSNQELNSQLSEVLQQNEELIRQDQLIRQMNESANQSGEKIRELGFQISLLEKENARLQSQLGQISKRLETAEENNKEQKRRMAEAVKEKQGQLEQLRGMVRQELEKKDREIKELQNGWKGTEVLQKTMKSSANWSSQDEVSQALFASKEDFSTKPNPFEEELSLFKIKMEEAERRNKLMGMETQKLREKLKKMENENARILQRTNEQVEMANKKASQYERSLLQTAEELKSAKQSIEKLKMDSKRKK